MISVCYPNSAEFDRDWIDFKNSSWFRKKNYVSMWDTPYLVSKGSVLPPCFVPNHRSRRTCLWYCPHCRLSVECLCSLRRTERVWVWLCWADGGNRHCEIPCQNASGICATVCEHQADFSRLFSYCYTPRSNAWIVRDLKMHDETRDNWVLFSGSKRG